MEDRPVINIAITRAHLAILATIVALALVGGGVMVAYASGAAVPILGRKPTATVPYRYSVPTGPSLSDLQAKQRATSEAQSKKACDDAWRSYQDKYNSYLSAKAAGRTAFEPSKPFLC